jgi:O-antigen/teichoic acid export membrane protein
MDPVEGPFAGSAPTTGAAPAVRPRDELVSLARGGALNLVGVVTNGILGFLLVVIVTRGFGPTTTGLFFEAAALFLILAAAAQWGADVGVVRMVPRYRTLERAGDVRAVMVAALLPAALAGIALAAILAVLAEPIAGLLTNGRHGRELAPVLRALAPFVPVNAVYTVALGATRGAGTMLPTTAVDKIARAALQPAFALAIVLAGASILALSLAWAAPFLIGLVAISFWLAALVRGLDDRGRLPRSVPAPAVFREFWRFTLPRGLASLFAVSTLWLATLVIGALRTTAEAGMYAAAIRYVTLGQFVGVAVAQVTAPSLSAILTKGDRATGKLVYSTATSWLVSLVWPLYLTMIVLGPALLSIFGSGYREAAPVLSIIGTAMLVATIVGPVDMVLLMAGKSSWNLLNTIVAVVVNVALNLALVPTYGIRGAAVAWAASILANNLLPLVQVWRIEGLHPFGSGTLLAGASALVSFGLIGAAARALLGPTPLALVAVGVVGGLAHLLVLWRLRDHLHMASLRASLRRRPAPAP